VPDLVIRCLRLRPSAIVLIKANVYDAAYGVLKAAGMPVIDERIPFPSTGHQSKFRERFREALRRCRKTGALRLPAE
jgi:hypothetical protein